MSQKKSTPRRRAPSTSGVPASDPLAPDRDDDRDDELQRLDRALLELLNRRAEMLRSAAQTTPSQGGSRNSLAADEQCLQWVVAANHGPLRSEAVRAIFRELLSGSRALSWPKQVVYLGPEYSYSHLAAVEQFGLSSDLIPVATIAAVFDAVNRGQADFGLVPIENSTDGRVADTLDMFARLPLRICGEVQLRIRHYLLGTCSRKEVREVCSKPQALSQCRAWLARHLPEARLVETASTTAAARLAAEKAGVAAIASRQAGVNYGLNVIAAGIEDNQHNVTRFAVIGGHSPTRSGNDKSSLMFELPHQPGSLADAMTIFKRGRLNLTWIESFPMPNTPNEYLFFVELQGHPDDPGVKRALAALRRKTVRLEVLGSYPASEPIG
ncbi:MAG: prephenate dehydratase [Pirellulaceae bacterium]